MFGFLVRTYLTPQQKKLRALLLVGFFHFYMRLIAAGSAGRSSNKNVV